jgi:signal transduction histidine kinase
VIDVGGQKLIMSLARDVTERKRQQAELVARSQQIAALQATLQERERISREMHDGLAQVLGYIGYKIHAIADMLQKGDIAQARAGLHEVGGVARSAYADIREAILGLRTSITPDIGLMACLKEYMVRFQREWGIQTELIVEEGVPTSFPPATEVQLLRIIQEAMTNIRKHAEARRAVVRFARMGDHTSVIIQDDGKGFDPATVPGQHYGLATMRERAQLVNANLKIETGPNQGTRVIIGLPNGDGMVQEV